MGKGAGDSYSPLGLFIELFEQAGSLQSLAMGRGSGEDGEPFGHAPLHPFGQFEGCRAIFFGGNILFS